MNSNYCIFNNNTNKKTINGILLNVSIRRNSKIVVIEVLKCLNCFIFYCIFRMFDCSAAVLHHLDDIKIYLEQNLHVLNATSIIDRGYLDIEILKPIFWATSLMGMHITSPLTAILLDTNIKYSTIMYVFQKLYNDMK